MRIRVGMVDDHPAVLLGLANIINTQTDMFVAGFGATVTELLDLETELDVVLLDLVLADDSSPAQNVADLNITGAAIIAYSSGDRPFLVREASRAGVAGMVRKSEAPETVIAALRTAAAGEVVATAEWAAALDTDVHFVSAKLTEREAEVLALYASGETAERVGAQLYISRETVLDHIRRIRKKYLSVDRPAQTKIDLFRRAVEDGFVNPAG